MYGLLILDSNKCYNWEPLSWSILIHPSSPLKAATCAGVCPSLSLIFTSGVYCSSVRRHSLCPPTHTSWRGVRPVFVLETGLWFCYRDIIKYIFHNYLFLIIMYNVSILFWLITFSNFSTMESWPYVQAMCSGVFPKESTSFSDGKFSCSFCEAALSTLLAPVH